MIIDSETYNKIIDLTFNEKLSALKISKIINIPPKTIEKLITKYKKQNNIPLGRIKN